MNLDQLDLPTLLVRLRTGALDLYDYLGALEAHFEQWEPQLLAFVPENGRFERLHREAETLLQQYPHPQQRPLLFGLPVGVKDIFHVDGFTTRAGSQLPAELLQGEESAAVTRLRAAGALILGKTVTTEFAYFAPGPTRNPHNPGHTPGGSSSGSAAAVAASLCPVALGTQTIGSINRPAAYCGVVGFKPSAGRILPVGVIPLAPTLDHVGFFTRQIVGADLIAGVLCQPWRTVTRPLPRKPVLGIPEGPYLDQASTEGKRHLQISAVRLEAAGFTVKAVAALPDFAAIRRSHERLMAAEAARVHAAWFGAYAHRYHSQTARLIRTGQGVSEAEIEAGQAQRLALRKRLMALMDAHGLDVWLTPAATGAAPRGLQSTGNPVMNLPWTNAGLPTLSVPAGVNTQGLPLGLQLVGRWQADEALLAAGAMIETAVGNGA